MGLSFGSKLRFYRNKRKISQFQLELETGCAFGVMSRFENNKVIPNLQTINKISSALKLTDKEFLDIWKLFK
jgi:transcriptional regulator with XRE-family HTH domain